MGQDVQEADERYRAVNAAVNAVLFDGRFQDRPVYLDIEGELADELAGRLGVTIEALPSVLADTVAHTIDFGLGDPFLWHFLEFVSWDRAEPPPFTALLCVLSIAAENMSAEGKFSAGNYHERLSALLDLKTITEKNSIKQNFKSTETFWKALNGWLLKNDLEFGRPTAQQVNGWKYVSYAISQALVRQADRERFHKMFAQFGLTPGERVSESEIEPYLNHWFGQAHAPKWLKKLWGKTDLRGRVAAAARFELEIWDGSDAADAGGTAKRRLLLAGSLTNFPRLAFELFLVTPASKQPLPDSRLSLEQNPSATAEDAFSAVSGGLRLEPMVVEDLLSLGPRSEIALGSLLLASFQLEDRKTKTYFHRSARAIVPLARLDNGLFYKEVSRVSLLRPHLLLCHAGWKEGVMAFLRPHVRDGVKVLEGAALAGIPDDWVVIANVEMISVPQDNNDNLQALIPMSEVSMEVSGGLQLLGGFWHSQCPPEIVAAADEGPLSISVLETTVSSGSTKIAAQESDTSYCRLDLSGHQFAPGSNYHVEAHRKGMKTRGQDISFRSADSPRPLNSSRVNALYWRLGRSNPQGLLSASAEQNADSGLVEVTGMRAAGCSPIDASVVGGDSELEYPLADFTDDGSSQQGIKQGFRIGTALSSGETCILRGYHHWICQDFEKGGNRNAPMWMTCNGCGVSHLTRNRNRRRGLRKTKKHRGQPQRPAAAVELAARSEALPSEDTLFDAICFLGSGRWPRLRDLITSSGVSSLSAHRLIQNLVALGHIDAASLAGGVRFDHWACAPATIVWLSNEAGYLAGFRSDGLVDDVQKAAVAAGGKIVEEAQKDAPAAIFVRDCDREEMSERLEQILDSRGRPLCSVNHPAMQIATMIPDLNDAANALPELQLESGEDLQCFSTNSGKWIPASDTRGPGAYRASFAGRTYAYRPAHGSLKEAPRELAKLLAAREAGVRLHAYDRSSREFLAHIGCEPPAIIQRALVSSSGLCPSLEDGVLRYPNVSPDLAAVVLNRFYGGMTNVVA